MTFQLGRRMSSSQKGCGTSVTSSKPVAIGSSSGLVSTVAASSIDGGWATRLTMGRTRCGEVGPRVALVVGEKLLVGAKLLLGTKLAACVSKSSIMRHLARVLANLTGGKHVT